MSLSIRDQLVTARNRTWPGVNRKTSITVHETANTSRGANAAAHANLQSRGNTRQASWHIQVDDREAVRSFPDDVRCWHAGPNAADSLSLEICVNADGDYDKALANAAEVVKAWRAKYGLGRDAVRQHYHWTGKNCPTRLRAAGRWAQFVAATDPDTVAGDGGGKAPAPKPKKEAKASVPVLSLGSTGSAVKVLQREMNRVFPAYSRLAVDGHFGPATEKVVREFQRRAGLEVDGYVGPATQEALTRHGVRLTGSASGSKPAPKPKASSVLSRGSSGSAVRTLQREMNRVFPAYSRLAVDGHFGPATEKAVREFQRRAGLKVDGYVGPATQAALRRHGVKLK